MRFAPRLLGVRARVHHACTRGWALITPPPRSGLHPAGGEGARDYERAPRTEPPPPVLRQETAKLTPGLSPAFLGGEWSHP